MMMITAEELTARTKYGHLIARRCLSIKRLLFGGKESGENKVIERRHSLIRS